MAEQRQPQVQGTAALQPQYTYTPAVEEIEPLIPNTNPGYLITKRIFDIVFSMLALIVTSPISLITAIAIKIEDPTGSIIYKQIRIGKNGVPFSFYKFRSMIANADKLQEKLQKNYDPNSPFYKIKGDPRITKVGRFIRKYSIDELPQFLNVIRGQMSIVGPRPLQPHEAEDIPGYLDQRQKVVPGLTCFWQVDERSDGIAPSRIQNDLRYIRNQSFAVDIGLVIRTVPAVFSGKGAA
ncbi:multidrug MFS transporter [Clostridia bacterium]|nr:multidrug MFS transporter [Clostridia bacterium]